MYTQLSIRNTLELPETDCFESPIRRRLRIRIFNKEETQRLSSSERHDVSQDLASVTAMKLGDQSALAELYDRYSSVVYAVALRVLGDTGAAEDVLQEVFLQLWRNPGAFDAARGNLGAWLAVIARNRAIDSLRRRKPESDIEDVIVSVAPDLAGEADRSRAAEKIRAVLGAMPAPQRSALEMAYFEGMSHSEIAGKTGEPLGTIKTRIRAGLMTLRKAFQT
jgi:RNA polymerase sigma-70 factor (ECF subfamily)